LDGDLPPVEKLRMFVLRHLSYFDEHREFFRVLLWERQIAETHLRRQQSDPFRTYVEKIAAVLREGARAKILRPLDPVKVAAVFIEADIAMIAQRLLMDSPGSVEEDARMLTDVILNGLSLKRTGPARRT
jgi:AcrR family transcriptional regulator